MGLPELVFLLNPLGFVADGTVKGSMPTGPWLSDPELGPQGLSGALGVLVDDVLGYAINAHAVAWSVSTEISLDLVGSVPTDGSLVRAEGFAVHKDQSSAFARGAVVDESGETIAYAQERSRFIDAAPAPGSWDPPSAPRHDMEAPTTIAHLFGGDVLLQESGAEVNVGQRLANPLGNLHGGMSLCLAEWLAARATPTLARTSSIRVQYVRPLPKGAHATVRATVDHRGRSLGAVRVVMSDAAGRPCTIASVLREGHPA